MKKILAILSFALAVATVNVHAQTPDVQGTALTYTAALDTNTNATTSYAYIKNVLGSVQSWQFTVTKISGTVGGSVILEASINGTSWFSIGDTLTLANQATNVNGWLNTTLVRYKHYRARYTTTGTQASYLEFNLFAILPKQTTY